MCGRFVQLGPVTVYAAMFDIEGRHTALARRYNVAPTQSMMACRERNGHRELQPLRWGLVPQWSKGPDSRYGMINARAETVHQKPAYRGPFRSRRGLLRVEAWAWRQATLRDPHAVPRAIRLRWPVG